MLWICIFVLLGLFIVVVSYYGLTTPVMTILAAFETAGTPSWIIDSLAIAYHASFVILAVGVLIYGFIAIVKSEPDTYSR